MSCAWTKQGFILVPGGKEQWEASVPLDFWKSLMEFNGDKSNRDIKKYNGALQNLIENEALSVDFKTTPAEC